MKNTIVGLIIAGGCLLLLIIAFIIYRKKNQKPVKPADWHVRTRVNKPYVTEPDPNNPIKFNIPKDYGIGDQRKDQLRDYNFDGSVREREYYPPPKGGKRKKLKKRRVK